jgi:thiamine pyrophosphokinase
MDSISDDSRAWATTQDARFEIADPDKDQTDTELALSAIVSWRPRALTVLWGGGDRIDHVLGVMAAVAAPPLSALDRIDLWVANDLVQVLHGPRSIELDSPVGTTVSLVPLGGPVTGVTTTGLKWELDDATLRSDSARGVSNVVVGAARVDIGAGVLAVIVSARALIESATDVRVHHHEENP